MEGGGIGVGQGEWQVQKRREKSIVYGLSNPKHTDRHGLLSIYSFYTKSANNS